jgi:hypothetical protein
MRKTRNQLSDKLSELDNAELSAAISYTTGFGAEHVTWNDHRQTSPGGERQPALMCLVH